LNTARLLAAGLSVRAISAETGIPVGAVHRAKRQIEKAMAGKAGQQATVPLEPPPSVLVQRFIDGIRQDVRQTDKGLVSVGVLNERRQLLRLPQMIADIVVTWTMAPSLPAGGQATTPVKSWRGGGPRRRCCKRDGVFGPGLRLGQKLHRDKNFNMALG
jgi:hypothetical protein